MISNTVVNEIRRLLLEKRYSQRKIALRLGVSRGTVNSIATGKRPDYSRRKNTSECGEDGFFPPEGLPKRCPQCGAMVMMPCLACHVRALSGICKIDRPGVDSPRSARC
ncbi:MAG: helix-turn-helix transcriptional regulator [Pirellulales bacterium]|nr:helix-turn-helix transcriptional regulator [Pirellulales bacterium]